MTTAADLQRLIEACIRDPRREPEFLRALLDADLYVHLPWSDDSPKLRLVCFTRPDGLSVIPVFSDEAKAERAAQGAVRLVVLPGRTLFTIAPGATFMLDPNDTSTTLYPEEIRALLSNGVATVAPLRGDVSSANISPALIEDCWLGHLLISVARDFECVKAVHLVQSHLAGSEEPTALLAVFAVDAAHGERVARAVGLALESSHAQPRLALDLTVYDPGSQPDWASDPCFAPIWRRMPAGVH
jgi:hypothetical protein